MTQKGVCEDGTKCATIYYMYQSKKVSRSLAVSSSGSQSVANQQFRTCGSLLSMGKAGISLVHASYNNAKKYYFGYNLPPLLFSLKYVIYLGHAISVIPAAVNKKFALIRSVSLSPVVWLVAKGRGERATAECGACEQKKPGIKRQNSWPSL
jgi:hypothetical protein